MIHICATMADSLEMLSENEELVAQRRWPRFLVDMAVQVTVRTQGPTKVLTWQGQGSDISGGGLALTVASDLPIGSQIAVEFALPDSDRSLSFRCFVRNRNGQRYGVEFITENDEDYARAAELQSLLGCDAATVSN
jgi:PilZ domain